jgi:hypothetical protein
MKRVPPMCLTVVISTTLSLTITVTQAYFWLKRIAIIRIVQTFSIPDDSKVLSDEMVYVGTPQKRMENVLLLIHAVDLEGVLNQVWVGLIAFFLISPG